MSEREIIQKTPIPRTRGSLARDLRTLGVEPGMVLLVHSSLSALGWVCGGPVAAVQALMDVLTTAGTLVMPTQSGDTSDPAHWQNPPVPQDWIESIRRTMPAYDPRITPTRGMGRIVETFRTWPGVIRSSHPNLSFAAWGAHAEAVVRDHSLNDGLGEESPLARLYDMDGWVLLLGVGYDSNTCFHLAEYRAAAGRNGQPTRVTQGAPIIEEGRRVWKSFEDIDLDPGPFPQIGAAFDGAGHATVGKVGSAEATLFHVRTAVDFARDWLMR